MHRPWWRKIVFSICWVIGWVVLTVTCRIRVEGEAPKGPAILISNHPSYLDGPLALYVSPRVRIIAKPNPLVRVRWTYWLLDVFLTRRSAVADARRHLRAGGIVWIMPEGGLSPGPMRRPRCGAARIAQESGAPLVPAGMVGTAGLQLRTWRPWRRPPVRIVLGKPRYALPEEDPRELMEELMRELSRLTGTPYQPR
jgi:1-acyl-sn-glycerol-3-phosphate acyltransferase